MVGLCKLVQSSLQQRLRIYPSRDAATTGAAGAVAPIAFCLHNFMGALRVQIRLKQDTYVTHDRIMYSITA